MTPESETLVDSIFRRLSEAIVRGEIAPGAKISEPQLARRLGISRGPLREAIRRLQERRLVTHSPNQGVRVVVPSPEMLDELLVLREALEGIAAREATLHITNAEAEALDAMLGEHAAMMAREDASFYPQEANSDFHSFIARVSRNRMLIDLLCGEYDMLLRFYRMQHKSVPGRARRALVEHRRIADAIRERDADLAELLMRRHMRAARAARAGGGEGHSAAAE